jgi:hypothetical protein
MSMKLSDMLKALAMLGIAAIVFLVTMAMDLQDFLNAVRNMRKYQKAYFSEGRKQSDLVSAKNYERFVDKALAEGVTVPGEIVSPETNVLEEQQNLFEEQNNEAK